MSTRRRYHPDFERAAVSERWRGAGLKMLWRLINIRAEQKHPDPVRYVLPDGAFVALRLIDGRRELLLYRQEAQKTSDGPALWKAEVETFAKNFEAEGWEWRIYRVRGRPRATALEPRRLV